MNLSSSLASNEGSVSVNYKLLDVLDLFLLLGVGLHLINLVLRLGPDVGRVVTTIVE